MDDIIRVSFAREEPHMNVLSSVMLLLEHRATNVNFSAVLFVLFPIENMGKQMHISGLDFGLLCYRIFFFCWQ